MSGKKYLRWKNISDLALLRYIINARTLLDYGKGTGIEVICSCMNIESSQLAVTSMLCLNTITRGCEFFFLRGESSVVLIVQLVKKCVGIFKCTSGRLL